MPEEMQVRTYVGDKSKDIRNLPKEPINRDGTKKCCGEKKVMKKPKITKKL